MKDVNKELKTVLFRYDLTYEDIAKQIGRSRETVVRRINHKLLSQLEMESILKLLHRYDRDITESIFFKKEVNR